VTESISEANSLSNLLYQLDPMHTCCVENECFDEYSRVAAGIYARIKSGQGTASAIHDEFLDWFETVPPDRTINAISQFLDNSSVSR